MAVTDYANGIDDTVPANDYEANYVGCQIDPRKEDELLQRYQRTLLSCNEEIYRLGAENDTLTRKSKAVGFDVTKDNNDSIHLYTGLLNVYLFMWVVDTVRDNVNMCRTYISV